MCNACSTSHTRRALQSCIRSTCQDSVLLAAASLVVVHGSSSYASGPALLVSARPSHIGCQTWVSALSVCLTRCRQPLQLLRMQYCNYKNRTACNIPYGTVACPTNTISPRNPVCPAAPPTLLRTGASPHTPPPPACHVVRLCPLLSPAAPPAAGRWPTPPPRWPPWLRSAAAAAGGCPTAGCQSPRRPCEGMGKARTKSGTYIRTSWLLICLISSMPQCMANSNEVRSCLQSARATRQACCRRLRITHVTPCHPCWLVAAGETQTGPPLNAHLSPSCSRRT